MRTDWRRRRPGLLLVVTSFLALALIVGTVLFLHARSQAPGQADNPFALRSVYVDPAAKVSVAAQGAAGNEGELLRRLAAVPTGIWLTPEEQPAGQVGSRVKGVAEAAHERKEVAVFVVYGITQRDCTAGESSGGLPAGEYAEWVREIASAAGPWTVAILEPDALASAQECDLVEQRVQALSEAVEELREADVTTYIDAGHSNWTEPVEMADLLDRVGVESVRGFATNTSAFGTNAEEVAYARQVASHLDGAHFVVDSSRNGAGGNGEWCNPQGRAVGTKPGYVDDGGLDAYLWIKPPGESDGECNGGPAAGAWSTDLALDLVRNAEW
ncbi:endoglucanase [Nocardioides daedukensis]|uniref:Glucanase n=1 Tax=Nocardioides daedukensis TaxID=634462 RepID=A0A7Y9UQ80_9ACTN|nr:glycoside hydrolase family 6 protein [Nocardioides daedukensis]NYG60388.1 endoglucanase [Nocardioides daedukensis]